MARKSISPTTPAEPVPALATGDAAALWGQWLAAQRELADAGFEQMTQSQQAMLQAWVQWVEFCWPAWTPFLERGGEQLA